MITLPAFSWKYSSFVVKDQLIFSWSFSQVYLVRNSDRFLGLAPNQKKQYFAINLLESGSGKLVQKGANNLAFFQFPDIFKKRSYCVMQRTKRERPWHLHSSFWFEFFTNIENWQYFRGKLFYVITKK